MTLPGGRRKYFYGDTRAEAEERLAAALRALRQGLPIGGGRPVPPVDRDRVRRELADLEAAAWEALAGQRYLQFGHLAELWMWLNRIAALGLASPFQGLAAERDESVPVKPPHDA